MGCVVFQPKDSCCEANSGLHAPGYENTYWAGLRGHPLGSQTTRRPAGKHDEYVTRNGTQLRACPNNPGAGGHEKAIARRPAGGAFGGHSPQHKM